MSDDRSGRAPAAGRPFGRRAALLAFAVGFLAVGLPYWALPYRSVNFPDALLTPALLAVAGAAAALRGTGATSFWNAVWIAGASVPAAVLARVAVEVSADPTSHNLWPFELALAAPVGLACALAGAALGQLAAAVAARGSGERP